MLTCLKQMQQNLLIVGDGYGTVLYSMRFSEEMRMYARQDKTERYYCQQLRSERLYVDKTYFEKTRATT